MEEIIIGGSADLPDHGTLRYEVLLVPFALPPFLIEFPALAFGGIREHISFIDLKVDFCSP
jgi:hypothetical protein